MFFFTSRGFFRNRTNQHNENHTHTALKTSWHILVGTLILIQGTKCDSAFKRLNFFTVIVLTISNNLNERNFTL